PRADPERSSRAVQTGPACRPAPCVPCSSACGTVIPHAAAGDTNPKRERGLETIPSFTLRVSIECLISDRAQYNGGHPPLSSCPLPDSAEIGWRALPGACGDRRRSLLHTL